MGSDWLCGVGGVVLLGAEYRRFQMHITRWATERFEPRDQTAIGIDTATQFWWHRHGSESLLFHLQIDLNEPWVVFSWLWPNHAAIVVMSTSL